jgi:response regulator NasT
MTFRIVIAEDEPLTRRDLAEMLRDMGHQVVGQARNGRDALTLVEDQDPDIVLLDVVMPDLDGIETARRVSRQRPVVLLTAHSSPDYVSRALDAGVMAYLGKPFREQDLAPTIQLAVSNFLAQSQLSQRVQRLSRQLEARKVIERARGLLMEKDGLSEGEAYRRLRELSMERGLPLARVSEAVIAALGE